MIVLDTHIWFWWVEGSDQLSSRLSEKIRQHESSGLLVSAISLLEVSCASSLGRMTLSHEVKRWLELALDYPGVRLIPLDACIVSDAYRLPEPFHKDPADRIIVSTARVLNCPLLTLDEKILAYEQVPLA